MTNKELELKLKNYRFNKCKIQNINLDIEELQEQLLELQQQDEILLIQIQRLNDLKRELTLEINRINSALATLSDREKLLIELRYFKRLSWNEISNELHLSLNHLCNRIRPNALKNLSNCLN